METIERFENLPETALAWHRAGRGAALATVIETWGSAPRGVGSQLAISGDGEIAGSVSGGCVEGAVVLEAIEAIETGKHCILEYGVSDGDAFAVGLACGGTIRILVEPVGAQLSEMTLAELVDLRAKRIPAAYVVNLETGAAQITTDGYEAQFRMDRSGVDEDAGVFVAIHNPPLRLYIVGAVHIAQALVPMAHVAGYDVTVIDPRESFASEARFPDVTLSHDWPDEALEAFKIDGRSALVLLTHDPKLDDPALEVALVSNCFYIGALGSKRTHGKRVERLTEKGFSSEQIARINGPIGLNIGGSGPAEIAVSVIAQMTQVLRQGA